MNMDAIEALLALDDVDSVGTATAHSLTLPYTAHSPHCTFPHTLYIHPYTVHSPVHCILH
jgi:hypothetical protein